MPLRNRNRTKGFTLIELMVVIVILGLLVTLVAPNFTGILEDAKVDTTKAQMHSIEDSIKLYKLRKGKLPDSLNELIPDFLPGPDLPRDGWDKEFQYSRIDKKTFDIWSLGADGEEGGTDTHDADIHLEDLRKKKEQ